jgi:hypothetical protein
MQYSAKNQSTPCCQSLITPERDHPLVLESHMALNLLLDECIDNTHILVIKEKRKKKRNNWKNNVSTHPRQNHAQANTTNHQSKAQKTQRAPPARMQTPPEPMQLPLDECMRTTSQNRAATSAFLWPGQTDQPHWSDRCARSPSIWKLTPVRTVEDTSQADDHLETARAQN